MENKNLELIPAAVDGGNNELKIIVNGAPYFIKTIMKKTYESRLVFGTGDDGSAIDYLDVDIETNGITGSFYAGELALRNAGSGTIESLGGYKSANDMLIAEMVIGLAYALADQFPEQTSFNVKLGTGLPTHEFFFRNEDGRFSFEKVKVFQKKLTGIHKIKFNTNLLRKKTVTLEIAKVIPNPECHAALFRLLNDPKVKEMHPELYRKNANILGLDIGGSSSDVSGICNGNYVEQAMFGIDKGINRALDKACEVVKTRANLASFTRYDMNNYLFDPELKGILETNKGVFDLNKEKQPFYRNEAESIAFEFRKKLSERGMSLNMVHGLFLLGGASLELGDYIIEQLKDDIPRILRAGDYVGNPRLLNAEAYYDAALNMA